MISRMAGLLQNCSMVFYEPVSNPNPEEYFLGRKSPSPIASATRARRGE